MSRGVGVKNHTTTPYEKTNSGKTTFFPIYQSIWILEPVHWQNKKTFKAPLKSEEEKDFPFQILFQIHRNVSP